MARNVTQDRCNKGMECESCTHTTNPLLTGINVESRSTLDSKRTVTFFKQGDLLFREGLYPSGLLCLNKGKVMVAKKDAYENKVVIGLQKEVSFLGIADFITGKPYQSDCYALEDCTECMIKRNHVHKMMNDNKFFMKNVLEEIATQFHQSNLRLLNHSKKHMQSRLADALYFLYDVFGMKEDGVTLDVYLKRKDLASLSNMNVSNVIRHLATLHKEGVIATSNKSIAITNLSRLEGIKNFI